MTVFPFLPFYNPGSNTFAKTVTIAVGSGNTALVIASGTVNLTGASITAGTFAAPVFSGTITGTYTLAGTPTIASPTITAPTITGAATIASGATITDPILPMTVRSTAQVDVTSSTALVVATGLSVAVVAAGVYSVKAYLATTAGASGGIKVALVGTASMTATSANYTAWNYNGTTVNAVSNTTTFGNAVGAATAITTAVVLEGTVVVNAAGNLQLQFAQNASNGTATSVFANSYMQLTRIA